MKKIIATLKISTLITMLFFSAQFSNAQVGINTTSPDPSSMLDVSATDKGMLTPRMTTAQKNAITTPANGLLVYDTDYKEFSYYDAVAGWINIKQGRTNFKRIKSTDVLANVLAAELLAGGGTKYVMSANTLYEINGTVFFDFPIEMNNAYISGLDSGDDKIVRTTGNIFDGATGGTIKGLTLVAATGKVFNISGANTENIIFRDCIVANSFSVGSINGLGLVFFSVVQFSGNTTGIEYSNISQLLLSNMGWFGNNSGTFEKLTGSFGLVQKQGGFSDVTSATFGFDVSGNPTISSDAVLESVVFTGDATGTKYVNPYPLAQRYPGYNFSNSWNVRSTGIPNETDADAGGGFSMDYGVGTGISVAINNNNPSSTVKVGTIATSSPTTNLFRFSSDSPNNLKYLGKKKRIFQVTGSISIQVPGAATYIVYISKNGTALSEYKVYGRGQVNADIIVLPIIGNVELSNGDYVDIRLQRFTGVTSNPIVPNLTIILR